ncbi:MAG: CDP-alcohol phosphatidyltransferase family protein [Gemmatimonadota bacterium]
MPRRRAGTVGWVSPDDNPKIATRFRLIPKPVERTFYAVLRPIVDGLIRAQIRPNTITTIGTALVLLSAVAFGLGHIRIGGLVLLLSGVTDTLDGAVARGNAMVTRFGAFYDSTLDRVGDGATFMGIAIYFMSTADVAQRMAAVSVCMIAIIASLIVSYARARAEGLGLDCKVGIAQRAERILLVGVCTLIFGAGPRALLLEGVVGLLALASVITVVQRFVYVYQVTQDDLPPRTSPHAAVDSTAKGSVQ